MISVARRIATHFNHSSLACDKLIKIQKELNTDQKKIIQDVQTRWNSTFYMLKRLNELKRCITIYLTEHSSGVNNLTNNQLDILQSVLELLQPFEEITRSMSNENSIISDVIPTIATLKRYLSSAKIEVLYGVGSMKEELINGISTRFSLVESTKNYTIATILDPRYKVRFFSSQAKVDEVKMALVNEIEQINQIGPFQTQVQNNNEDSDSDDEPLAKKAKKIEKNQSNVSRFVSTSTTNARNALGNAILDQLNIYYKLPIIDRDAEPIGWWNDNQNIFPSLSSIARKYLSSSASSVYSERLFSEIGNIYTDNRSRLSSDNAEKLLFIHHNLKRINFDYQSSLLIMY